LKSEYEAYFETLSKRQLVAQVAKEADEADENIQAAWEDLSRKPFCKPCYNDHVEKASNAIAILKWKASQ
jgi:hypothetical protein